MSSNLAHDLCGVPVSWPERLGGVHAARGLEGLNGKGGEAMLVSQAPTRTSDHLASEDAGIPQAGIPGVPVSWPERLGGVHAAHGSESLNENGGEAKLDVQAPTRTSDHLASEDAGIPQAGIPQAGTPNSKTPAHKVFLDIPQLPAFMQNYISLASRHTDADKGALLTAWLPVACVNIGNRAFIRSMGKKHYCSMWGLIIGKSTISRKSTCIRLALDTISDHESSLAGLSKDEREQQTIVLSGATNAKTISLLAKNSNRLFEFHEFASFLKSAKHSYNSGFKENLTALYDGDSKSFYNMDRSERINNPAISIVAASTEGWIYSDFQTLAEQNSGFLQRFQFCVINTDGLVLHTSLDETEQNYHDLKALNDSFEIVRSLGDDQHLKMSVAAQKLWAETHDAVMNPILASEEENLHAYAGRIYNNFFHSMCILITLMSSIGELNQAILAAQTSAFFSKLEVSPQTAAQALYLCGYYLANARPMLGIIGEAGSWEKERKILKYLAEAKDKTMGHSKLMRLLHLKSRDFNDAIKNLLEQESIEVISSVNPINNKGFKAYRLLNREL